MQNLPSRLELESASVFFPIPRRIIADEPTASLESAQGFEIIRMLYRLAKQEGRCVVLRMVDGLLVSQDENSGNSHSVG